MSIQKIIDKIRGKNSSPYFNHKIYGRIYYPIYNKAIQMSCAEPEIFNKNGQKMRTFFYRDAIMAYGLGQMSDYFCWDRYNFGLPIHFYSHCSMLETMGKPDKKYGMLIESESIEPLGYEIFKKYKGIEKDFDMIFTYSYELLNKLDNAKFVPFCSAPWNANMMYPEAYKNKTKNISIASSNKKMCNLHKFRFEVANICKKENLADTFGTFDGGKFVPIDETLRDYRYSICIENDDAPYFFTEKITSAFVAQTIPIYLGASKIDELFNPDGIIKITDKTDIRGVLKQCTKEEYERRLPAIKDNYERVKQFINPYNYMYEKYLA